MDPVTDSMEVNLEDEIITLPREKALKYSEYFRACHEHEGKFGHPGALSKEMVTKFAMLNIQWILARSEPEAKIICLPHDSIADVGDTLVSLDFLQFKKCIINAFGNYMFMLAEEDTWMCLWERAFFCNQKGIWKRLFEDNMGLMLSRVESRAGGFDFEFRILEMGIKAHRQTLETVSSVAREFIEKNPEAKSFSLPSEYSLPREGYYGAVKYLIESFYSFSDIPLIVDEFIPHALELSRSMNYGQYFLSKLVPMLRDNQSLIQETECIPRRKIWREWYLCALQFDSSWTKEHCLSDKELRSMVDVLCLRDFKYYLCNLVVGQKTLPILGDIFAWYRAFPEKRSLNIKKLLYLAHIDTDSLQEISEDDRKVFEGDQAFWSRVRSDVSSARQH